MGTITMNDKKTVRAWALFDWANSAYALVISTAIFPVYFTANSPEIVQFGSFSMTSQSLYSFIVSFSYILIAAISPILSGIADFGGKRMYYLRIFTTIGALSCMALFFFKDSSDFVLGAIAFTLATIGFSGSLVFYDSYLPLIVTEDQYDRVSARGYAYGYVGSVILLLAILAMILFPEFFGIESKTLPARIGFAMVGVWWISFAQITFRAMPKDSPLRVTKKMIVRGYHEIKNVFAEVQKTPRIQIFLLAFFFYSAGVQTVIYLATIFADQELQMDTSELIGVVLIIQLIGVLGAVLFARLSEKIGNKGAIMIQLCIWFAICLGAYLTQTKTLFYILAAAVGLVMGGIQALSRASYSKLLEKDEDDVTSYFSLYDVVSKVAIVAGTFLFGLVNVITNDMRNSVLALAFLFVIAFWLMTRVRIKKTN